ncbi:MAG: hypothetical protein J0H25_22320, partial [Rhizobiales bacterium]|nr:hypothetical protein [Hyphomicrobiales bacterium]
MTAVRSGNPGPARHEPAGSVARWSSWRKCMGCSIRLDFQNLEEEDAHHEVSEPDVFLRGKLPTAARIGRHADSSDLATLKLALSSETPFLSLGR